MELRRHLACGDPTGRLYRLRPDGRLDTLLANVPSPNGVALSPNLGDPVSKTSKEATFYFAMYPGKEGSGPNVVIELLQNGKPVAQLPMPVPPADANGRIQQLGRLPIDQLAPGT